jgi:hypothetical protein
LKNILEQPALVNAVQELEPEVFGKLVAHVGLEDSGELVALATTAQLSAALDEDVWKSQGPGADETFDAERFALWLEVMLEGGEQFVAEKLAELPEDLVVLGLQKLTLIIDLDALSFQMSEDDADVALTEKALDSCLQQEFDGFRVMSRKHAGWDALVFALLAMDRYQNHTLQRILERCAAISADYVAENGGLYEVLTSEQMLEADVSGEREDRRAAEGFIAPSSAASFLKLTLKTALPEIVEARSEDPVTRAYFRQLEPTKIKSSKAATTRAQESQEPVSRLTALLREAEIVSPEHKPALLSDGASAKRAAEGSLLREAFATLRHTRPDLYAQRTQELAYLANVLVAGYSENGSALRPREAVEKAVSLCNVGLEYLVAQTSGAARKRYVNQLVTDESAVKLFRIGFRVSAAPVEVTPRSLKRS